MSEFHRVKDKTTGHEFTVRHPDLTRVEVIEERAVDVNGRPLPAKPQTSEDSKSSASKKKTPTPGAESATTPKEGSA